MNTLKGFKDFDKVIKPILAPGNRGRRYTLPTIHVGWLTWQAIANADYCGIFEIQDYKISHHDRRDKCIFEMLLRIEGSLPRDIYIRLHVHNHKAKPVIVKLLGFCRDDDGAIAIQIEHSERFCYTTPVAGSMGDKKPEPQ